MKNGKCPKCDSPSVYSRKGGIEFGAPGGPNMYLKTDRPYESCENEVYVCTDCGYYETYIQEKNSEEINVLELIAHEWDSVF